MAGGLLAALAMLWGAGAAHAQDQALCGQQADAVERGMALPPGLLLAVGRVESGRSDPLTSDVLPWPWTVDDEGQDHVFGSAFDAIAYVVAARARGSRSLDVGCFQVNLQFHPDAFASLAEAFDPAANARVAGQFLSDLHVRSGSWEKAVEWYHSATPWRGEEYRDRVLSRWAETSLKPPRPEAGGAQAVSIGRTPARLVRVQYPQLPGDPPLSRGRRLPRVIVPQAYVAR